MLREPNICAQEPRQLPRRRPKGRPPPPAPFPAIPLTGPQAAVFDEIAFVTPVSSRPAPSHATPYSHRCRASGTNSGKLERRRQRRRRLTVTAATHCSRSASECSRAPQLRPVRGPPRGSGSRRTDRAPALGSFFAVFIDSVKQANSNGDHFFRLVNHSLACAACLERDRARECVHRLSFIPPWK